MRTVGYILVLIFAFPASAEPWAVSGQTHVNAYIGIDNPTPGDTGAIGAITDLPYTVPPGRILRIDTFAVEGYAVPGVMVIYLFTGELPPNPTHLNRNPYATASCAAHNGSCEFTGKYYFPEGTVLNLRLLNGQTFSGVYGWQATGELLDAQ